VPTIDDYKAHLIRSDYGLALLVGLVGLALVTLVLLWRRSARLRALNGGPGDWFPVLIPPEWILAGALLLRLPGLFQSLWYDESFTYRVATMTLSQLGPAITSDVHPPTYYFLIWLWHKMTFGLSSILGNPALWLRLPSLFFGLLAIWLLYRLVVALGLGKAVALMAAALVAVTPAAIYYADEMRNYSLLVCALLGALVAIFEDRPVWFVFCAAALGWLHNLGLLYVPVVCLVALIRNWQEYRETTLSIHGMSVPGLITVRRVWIRSVVIGGLLSLVWLPLLIKQSSAISDGFWIYFNAGVPFRSLTLNLMYLPRSLIGPLLLPYIGLGALAWYCSRRWLRTAPGALIALLIVGVPLLAILVSVVWAPVYLPRSFLSLNLLALIPLALALVRFPRLLVLALPLLILGLVNFFGVSYLLRPDYAGMVATGCAGADALYYTAIDTAITIAPVDGGRPSLVWAGGKDRGLTFKVDELPILNFKAGDISAFAGRVVCLPYIYTPRTLGPERQYVDELRRDYGTKVTRYALDDELEVDLILLSVPGVTRANR
jgi:hypothetical protein